MMQREYTRAAVTEKAERSVRAGHPWIYADEVTEIVGEYENGDLVDVYSKKARFLGTGFINDNSKIRVRLLSTNANDRFDDDFFRRRIRYALEYRRTVMGDASSYRVIFGEADGFPGLTVDLFSDVLVVQIMSLGLEKLKSRLFPLFIEAFEEQGVRLRAIVERSDAALRKKEGLESFKGFYMASRLDPSFDGRMTIEENGIKYAIDVINGQKTGFFLDQKFNRLAVARIAKDRCVLDCFTNSGSFALNCAAAGARRVTAVDISEDAIALVRHNAALNGLEDRIEPVKTDVFELLTDLEARKKRDYDLIILDPPAFTKSRETVRAALNGYKAINIKAMKLLPRGGYLATCSCSHFMTDELFRNMLKGAAQDAGVQLRQVEARKQAPDHPILVSVPETDYLKFYIFQVV